MTTPNTPAPTSGADWSALRRLFPAASRYTYLNTASYGPGPTPVVEAVQEGLVAWSEGRGAWRDWERCADRARGLFARLIGAEPSTVALLPSLSAAASQVAESLAAPGEPGGANLVVGAEEFRSNLMPWLNQERRGFELRLVPFVDGAIRAEDLLARTDARTRLVAVSHVQSASGYRVDLERLAQGCAAGGAALFVDATQSLGALRVPLAGVDYLATHAYKWLLAPRGSAFLYVAPARMAEQVPLQPSWKTPREPYGHYYGGPLEPVKAGDAAARLDGSLAWPVWWGTEAALELLLGVGLEAIEARNLALAQRFRAGLPALGLEPLYGDALPSPIVSLRVPDPDALERALDEAGVVAAVRDGHLRTSFHFFNDGTDVERALEVLRTVCGSVADPR